MALFSPGSRPVLPAIPALLLSGVVSVAWGQERWTSELYDAAWVPLPDRLFDSEKLVQDFSFAGYHRGERPIPSVTGPVFDVVDDFEADPTGTRDSTAQIQAAIDAASAAGGGVVFLPAGTFLVAPPEGETRALAVSSSNIVLRGAGSDLTFLLNTSYQMRGKTVVEITGPTPFWFWNSGTSYAVTGDLLKPGVRIPVADTAPFRAGDWIVIRMDATDEWITEHNEPLWLGYGSSLGGIAYSRQVLEIDAEAGELVIDAPTRYSLKTRDNTRVFIRNGANEESGLEDFAIGNVQHPGSAWGEGDYSDATKSAYDAHASYLIRVRNARNGWIRNVDSFGAASNTSTCHMLSNGILLSECRGFTVEGCHFQRPQYGGGGGNGYMFRLHNANECLVRSCVAEFNRHGLVFSKMASAGNVFLDCLDRTTGKATGNTGSYNTSGRASDHHMHFSHSNLIDVCRVDGSWFTAHYRPYGSTPKHNLTSAHTVFWNTEGIASPIGKVVHSQQARYGYVIGTRGAVTAVETGGNSTSKTAPVDHVEGIGMGTTLAPFSLYLDQRKKRLKLPGVDAGEDRELLFPRFSLELDARVTFGDSPEIPPGAGIEWVQVSGPRPARFADASRPDTAVAFPVSGEYVLACRARSAHGFDEGDFVDSGEVRVVVHPANRRRHSLVPTDDAYVRGGAENENDNFGAAASLWLKNVGNVSFERQAYLRFDLSPLAGGTPVEARLRLRGLEPDLEATGTLDHLDDDGWSETSLTWANRPTEGAAITTWSPESDFVQEFDLTSPVVGEAALASPLSLRLRIDSQADSGTVFKFASREHPDEEKRPRLEVAVEVPSPTFSEWIEGFPEVAPSERGPDRDPDRDGAGNLEEFFRGGNPSRRGEPGGVFFRDESRGEWGFELALRESLPAGAFVRVEFSESLDPADWRVLPGVTFEPGERAGGLIHWRIRLPRVDPSAPRGFYRVVYEISEPVSP